MIGKPTNAAMISARSVQSGAHVGYVAEVGVAQVDQRRLHRHYIRRRIRDDVVGAQFAEEGVTENLPEAPCIGLGQRLVDRGLRRSHEASQLTPSRARLRN